MATTNNAAVCPPDAIQVLQLFMNDSLARHEKRGLVIQMSNE
ncbi:hypothetical protein [Nitrosomonas sp.]|nr:hypothetical protein [Nitrosomonas sp.]